MSHSEKELEAIGCLIADLYSSICFERGERPPLDILKKVFIPGGRMINNDGDAPVNLTVEEYVERFQEKVLDAGMFESFHEMEVSHVTEVFGKIAHRFSTYETWLDLDDPEPYTTGINSIQLIKIGDAWLITSMVWNNQTEDRRIPPRYLP